MGSRTLASWRAEVYRSTAITDSARVLLLRLSDVMDDNGFVTVPRPEMAEWINRSERRVQERLENAVQGRLLDRVESGRRGRTATYRALWPTRDSGTVSSPLSGTDSETVSVHSETVLAHSETVQSPLEGADYSPLTRDAARSTDAVSGTHGGPTSIGEAPKVVHTRKRADTAEPEGFAEWYTAYPRNGSRPKAATAYGKALAKAKADDLLAAALRYRHDPNRVDEYTKLAATWLNNDCWLDDPLPKRLRSVASEPRQVNYPDEAYLVPFGRQPGVA